MVAVTIIVIAYNHAKDISKTIRAVKSLKFKQKIELIIIDNGSTDGTLSIIKTAIKGLSNITVLTQPQLFISVIVNQAIGIAHGEYVMLLEGDEILQPLALQILYQTLRQTDSAVVITAKTHHTPPASDGEVEKIDYLTLESPIKAITADHYLTNYLQILGVALYSRELLEKIKGADINCYYARFSLYLKACVYSKFILIRQPLVLAPINNKQHRTLYIHDGYQAIINFMHNSPRLANEHQRNFCQLLYIISWKLNKFRLDYLLKFMLLRGNFLMTTVSELIVKYKNAQRQLR